MVSGADLQGLEAAVTDHGRGRGQRACVNQVTVWSADQGSQDRVMWEIASSSDDCVWLARLTYGETPRGFTVVRAPERLRPDEPYDLFARGWTRAFPSIPWTAGGRVIFDQGRWSMLR